MNIVSTIILHFRGNNPIDSIPKGVAFIHRMINFHNSLNYLFNHSNMQWMNVTSLGMKSFGILLQKSCITHGQFQLEFHSVSFFFIDGSWEAPMTLKRAKEEGR